MAFAVRGRKIGWGELRVHKLMAADKDNFLSSRAEIRVEKVKLGNLGHTRTRAGSE